jgi:hypothetical protein
MVIHTYNPSYLEGRGRRTAVQGQPGQKHKTLSEKQTKAQRSRGLGQIMKCFPSKYKALNLNPDGEVSEPAVGPCVCELISGFVRKLQGTEAKASGPDCACVIWYLAL